MYNKYKDKYLKYKKLIGGSLTEEEFITKINEILNSSNSDDEKFEKIKEVISSLKDTTANFFVYYKYFNNKMDSLFNIILNLNVSPELIIGYANIIFDNFISGNSYNYFPTFINLFVNKIEQTIDKTNFLNEITKPLPVKIKSWSQITKPLPVKISPWIQIIKNLTGNFSVWVQNIILLKFIEKNSYVLTDEIINKYNQQIDPKYIFIIQILNLTKIVNSIDIYKQVILENNLNALTVSLVFNFNPQILSNVLPRILETINVQTDISPYYSFIFYLYTNFKCKSQTSPICLLIKDLIIKKNLTELKELTSKPLEELEPSSKKTIYGNYMQLLEFYTQKEFEKLFEDSETIMSKILDSRFYYFPTDEKLNEQYWDGIFSKEELNTFKDNIQQTRKNIQQIQKIRQIIPRYNANFNDLKQHLIIYATLFLVGKLNSKSMPFDSKIVIKGGKALQFRIPKKFQYYDSDDLDLLIISSNPFFAKSLAFNLSILVKWILNNESISSGVKIKFPNNTALDPFDNINIVKILFESSGEFLPGRGLIDKEITAIVDIDFIQYDSTKSPYNFFSEEHLELIDVAALGLKFYIQKLNTFVIEKIYYFIENYNNEFFMSKFSKSIQYVFYALYDDNTENQLRKSFNKLINQTNQTNDTILKDKIVEKKLIVDELIGKIFKELISFYRQSKQSTNTY